MSHETEAKIRVETFDAVVDRLTRLQAELVDSYIQTDDYYDNHTNSMQAGDECLRIRKQSGQKSQLIQVTYKGPRQGGNFKRRREIQIEVNDAEKAAVLFESLGFAKRITVEKRREMWHWGECEVALDQVTGLGSFVEIEGHDDESITAVQSELELDDYEHIDDSYATLLRDAGDMPT